MNHGTKDVFEAEKEVEGFVTAWLPAPRHFCRLAASYADESVHGSSTAFLSRCPSSTCVGVQGSPTQSHHHFWLLNFDRFERCMIYRGDRFVL